MSICLAGFVSSENLPAGRISGGFYLYEEILWELIINFHLILFYIKLV